MELVSQKSRMEDRVGQQQVALALAVLERDEAVRVPEEKREGGAQLHPRRPQLFNEYRNGVCTKHARLPPPPRGAPSTLSEKSAPARKPGMLCVRSW